MKEEIINFLKKLNVNYLEEDINLIAEESVNDEEVFYNNLKKISENWTPTEEMFEDLSLIPPHFNSEVGQFIQSRFSKIFTKYHFALLSDNVNFLLGQKENLKKTSDVNELCRISNLLGMRNISDFFFDNFQQECNPVTDKKILYCAICSKNEHLVRNIFSKFKNINLEKLNIWVYSNFINKDRLKEIKNESSNTSFNVYKEQSQRLESQIVQLSPIPNELLNCFDEILYGELEDFFCVQDPKTKKILTNILFDASLSIEQFCNLALAFYPLIGKRFSILHCCIFPEKWEEQHMKDLKKAFLNSFVDRSFSEIEKRNFDYSYKYQEKLKFLKERAKENTIRFLNAQKIIETILSEEERQEKENLKCISPTPIVTNFYSEAHSISSISKELEELIKEEHDISPIDFSDTSKQESIKITKPGLLQNFNSMSSQLWGIIYNLLKTTPQKHYTRPEDKMMAVLQAIVYKEENKCSWRQLQSYTYLSYTSVRHYYYEWKNNGTLENVIKILSNGPDVTLEKNKSII